MHKYRYLFRLIVVCVFFMFLLGCTNPKKASDSNFKAALDRHFQAHGHACVQLNGVDGKDFPLEVELGRPAWMGEGTLNLFEKQGLLASSELTKSVPDLSFMMSKRNREATTVRAY